MKAIALFRSHVTTNRVTTAPTKVLEEKNRKRLEHNRNGVQSMATLPVIIHLVEIIRRAVKKSGRGLFLFADAFGEALRDWREAGRKYPFAE
jgi:hypothetical protein